MSSTTTEPVIDDLGYGVDFKCGVKMVLFPESEERKTPALFVSVLGNDGVWVDWPIAVRSKGFSEFWKEAVAKIVGEEAAVKVEIDYLTSLFEELGDVLSEKIKGGEE